MNSQSAKWNGMLCDGWHLTFSLTQNNYHFKKQKLKIVFSDQPQIDSPSPISAHPASQEIHLYTFNLGILSNFVLLFFH